jgi:lipoprotein NlpI/transglutaminase-like putative cysteine protease
LDVTALAATKPEKQPSTAPAAAATPAAQPEYRFGPKPAWVVDPGTPQPPSESAAVQVLLMDHQTRLEPTGTVRYQHAVRAITSTAGLQSGSQITVDFDPSYQRVVLHQLQLLRDGKRIDKLDRKLIKVLHREPQLERQMVDGRKTLSIVLDDLRVGDRVEWSASVIGDNPVFDGHFVDTEWTSASLGPIGLVNLRLLAPANRNIRYRAPQDLVKIQDGTDKGWRELLIRRANAPQFHYDPTVPAADIVADQIEYSEFADWADVARWAEGLFKDTGGGPALTAKAAEIRAAAATPRERLQKALDFVQGDIRYFGTEIGANSHKPAKAEQVLQQRFGDCKDKSALLVNLLALLDIKATPALVPTYLRDTVLKRLPSPLNFDHAIAQVELDGQKLWLDGTRAFQHGSPESRNSESLGAALLARADQTAPLAWPYDLRARRVETVDRLTFGHFQDEGKVESVTVYYGGIAERVLDARSQMPAADFEKVLTTPVLRVYPHFTLDGSPVVEEVPGRNAVRVTLKLRTGTDYWRFSDRSSLSGEWSLFELMETLRLADQNPRTQALQISTPGVYSQSIEWVSDDPIYATESDSRFSEGNAQFSLGVDYHGGQHKTSISAELQVLTDRVEAAQWQSYRDALFKIWPRLANSMTISALSPSDQELMKAKLRTLRIPVGSTEEQVRAHVRVLATGMMLADKRLPPKARSQVLVQRGEAADHIGDLALGRQSFEEAAKLDPQSSEPLAALAVNAFIGGRDADAIATVDRALVLKTDDTASRYIKAYARHMSGDYAGARADLATILVSNREVDQGYGSIWTYLSALGQGQDAVKATDELRPGNARPAWPNPVLRYLRGEIDFKSALAEAGAEKDHKAQRECELYFFAGRKATLENKASEAKVLFRGSVGTGVSEFLEYGLAKRELARLGN